MGALRIPKEDLDDLIQFKLTKAEFTTKHLSDEDLEILDKGTSLFDRYKEIYPKRLQFALIYEDDEKRRSAIAELEFLTDDEKDDLEKYYRTFIFDLEQSYLRMKYKTSYVTLEMYEETYGSF